MYCMVENIPMHIGTAIPQVAVLAILPLHLENSRQGDRIAQEMVLNGEEQTELLCW